MIELRNIAIQKSGQNLFNNFNFHIEQGDNILITGENGSGKTTLLETIAGKISVTHGEVHYDFATGKSWEERYQQRKQAIHFIPADAALTRIHQPDLFYQQRYYSFGDTFVPTVKDFLGSVTVEQIQRMRFSSSLSIDHLLNLKLTTLSNGQQKRVMILANLAKQIPKVLLLDYPFEALDRQSRYDLIHFLEALSTHHGVQLILTDHDSALPSVLNRKVVLKDFQIHEQSRFIPTPYTVPDEVRSRNDSLPANQPVVEMRSLTIQYGETTIIKNLDWVIHQGERWALAGRNGSGKTTLFSLIYADHPMAYSQQVFLFGKRRGSGESIWDIKNRISYLGPEQMSFLSPTDKALTGRAYILKGNKNQDIDNLTSLLLFFEVDAFIDKPIRQMSSGQMQLVFIIKSLLVSKELLLLDEPFRFLDPHQKDRLSQYLQLYLNRETTLVLITHDQRDIERWGKQILWL
ncbi:MAG TPA: ATP-binding cassette domain-containing protein [Cyclobacteriaceae bacterium]|jgi:molybdate transport system ATP-binding protein|nr:ATP-binding cassette domain-containing protein [Cyclobacteriaceae bacterium]